MDRFKTSSSSAPLKRIQPRRRILNGLPVVECKICKARFKSLMPLSQHVIAVHQLKLSFKNRRKQKNNVHNRFEEVTYFTCSICKERFPNMVSFSEHIISQHQIALSLKNRPQQKEDVDDDAGDNIGFSGCKARNEDAVVVQDEEGEDDDDDDEDDEEDEKDDDDDDEDDEEDDDDVEDEDEDEDEDDEDEDDGVDDEVEGNELWFTDESLSLNCQLNAEAALEYLNEQVGGKRYELVEHGPAMASNPAIEHINFKAKEKDCPDAPNETFFAQMSSLRGMVVDCCVSLGPSHELPHWRDANLGGCKLCKGVIHHPVVMVDKLRLK